MSADLTLDPEPPETHAAAHAAWSTLLDTLGIAACAFDAAHRTLFWNRSFLHFFPEHDGHVYPGEPYADNLRRFYRGRMHGQDGEERAMLEHYVADGVARHAQQAAPFVFHHGGRWLRVGAEPLPGGGRLRVWTHVASPEEPGTTAFGAAQPGAAGADAVFERIAEAVLVIDPDGVVSAANTRFLALYRLASRAAVLGRRFADVLHTLWEGHDPPPGWELALRNHERYAGAPYEVPLPGDRWVRVQSHLGPDGLRYSVHTDHTALHRQRRELEAAEREAREGRERLRSEAERLAHSEARFHAAFDQAGIATAMLQADGRIADANAALSALLGRGRDALLQHRIEQFATPSSATEIAQRRAALASGETTADAAHPEQFEAELLRPDGEGVWVCLSYTAVRGSGPAEATLLVQVQDITGRKQAQRERDAVIGDLRLLATRDALTGLHNRRSLHEALAKACQDAAERNARSSVCFIDLDGFKQLNDHSGHGAGDAALVQVAELFTAQVRGSDIAGRLGGDEFCLLLHRCSPDQAALLADKLLLRLAGLRFAWDGALHPLGASIGVAPVQPGDTPEAVLQRADAACYRAKRAGRGRVTVAA